jgi:hypothetical protein
MIISDNFSRVDPKITQPEKLVAFRLEAAAGNGCGAIQSEG